MKKVNEYFNLISRAVFAACFCMQAVLALLWGICNITILQNYADSTPYIELAEKGASDGFHLYGYVLFVMFAKWVEGFTHLPYQSVLYVVQIVLCGIILYSAAAAFLRAMLGEKVRSTSVLLVCLFLLSNVYMIRLLFNVLPDGLAVSVLLLVLSHLLLWVRRIHDEKSYIYLVPAVFGCLFLGFLQWNFFWTGIASVTLFLAAGMIRILATKEKDYKTQKGKAIGSIGIMILLLAAVIVLVFAENRGIAKRTCPQYGAKYSFSADLSKRFRYPNPFDTVANYPVRVDDEVGEPTEVAQSALIKEAVKEYFSLVTSPVILSMKDYPFGSTPNPLYLNLMWQRTPGLTSFYYRVSALGFAICVVLSFIGILSDLLVSGKEKKKSLAVSFLEVLIIIAFTSVPIFLLSVPVFDYRNAMCAYGLWGLLTGWKMIKNHDRKLFFVGKEVKWEKQH